jgi:hypothetical protein
VLKPDGEGKKLMKKLILTLLTPSYVQAGARINGIAREYPMDSRDDDLRAKIVWI